MTPEALTPELKWLALTVILTGLLWIPYGIDDSRIGVAYAPLDEVLADLSNSL